MFNYFITDSYQNRLQLILQGRILLIEQQINQYGSLDEWFQSPLGLAVSREFTFNCKAANDYLKGETLLQLGNCGDNSWLNQFNFNRKWLASPYPIKKNNQIECSFNQIPLARNSLDCVVAPLTLEPFGSSFGLLDEIDRILKPMGIVILLCINPWSLWGAAMKCGLLHCYNDHKIKMRTSFNLNRTFLQRGYRQCLLTNICYIPPVNNQSLINKFTFFDEIGKMIWPFPSGFYFYIAQKHELIQPTPVLKQLSQEFKAGLQPV